MSEFVQRECRPLMDACTSALYSTNSFRVLGVAVTATSRQIKRRMDELKLAVEMGDLEEEYTHALLPSPLPDMDDLRRATKRLQDSQTRFVDEFFWFWPLNWEDSSPDQALQVLANGDRSSAENIWTEHLAGYPEAERLAATHNLAVLYHILAIDLEHDCHKNETPPLPAELEQLNTLWRTSFDWWEKLVDHEGFWDLMRERVLAIDDPSLSTGFVRRFRAVFPIAFDNINADFAAAHSKNGKHSRAALHIQFMQETHDGLDDVDESLSKVTRPLHSRIDAALNRATENLHDDPKDGINRADRLLAETAEPLKALSTLLGSGHAEVTETQDEVVEACCNCAIAYGNETEEWASGVVLLEKLRGLVVSEKLKSRIEKNLDILRTNTTRKMLQDKCWFCKKSTVSEGSVREVELHQETPSFQLQKVQWRHLKVSVPCCRKCKAKHFFMKFYMIGAALGVVIGGLAWSVTWLVTATIIGFIVGIFLDAKIQIHPKTAYKFPDVKELISKGWKKGEKPGRVEGTPSILPLSSPAYFILAAVILGSGVYGFYAMGGPEAARPSHNSSSRPSSYRSSSSSSSSYKSSSSGSSSSSSYSGYSSSSTRYTLGQEIDKEKARAKRLERDIDTADQEIESLKRRMNSYKTWNVDEYNRLVPVINQKVRDRNEIYEEYKRVINSVNTKVNKYNAMR
jgi:hypothetical protein